MSGSGLRRGRPFARYTAATALADRGSAAMPYAVSVGITTVPPAASTAATSARTRRETRWRLIAMTRMASARAGFLFLEPRDGPRNPLLHAHLRRPAEVLLGAAA